jgi:hypothetical protein
LQWRERSRRYEKQALAGRRLDSLVRSSRFIRTRRQSHHCELVKVLLGKLEVKAGSEQWRESEAEIASLAQKLRSKFEEKQSDNSGPACSVMAFADCRS